MTLTFILQVAAIVAFPLLITAAAMRRFRVTWMVLALGILFYLAQAGLQASFLAAILTSNRLMQSPAALATSLALLFGTFEEGGRWLGFIGTDTMQHYRNWGAAVVYGAGHGAAAAARIIVLCAIIPGFAAPFADPPLLMSVALAFAVIPEIIFQCGWSTLVMYAVIRRRARYLLVAVAGHVALYDAVFTMMQRSQIGGAIMIEIAGALVAITAAYYFYRHWPQQRERSERSRLQSSDAIAVRDLAFIYPGDLGHEPVRALNGISLEVRRGQVLALLGHNGAGKTTTLHILGGLLTPTSGRASIEGHDVEEQPDEVRKLVGLQRDEPGLYPYMPVAAYLNFFARLYDIPRDERIKRIDALLDILQLADKRDAAAGSLSKGSRQKVAFARTLIHEPQVLLLDEPTSGLDPVISMLVREMIGKLRQQGRTIVLATHNLYEAEALADDVAIVHHGRLIRHGKVTALERNGARRFTLRLNTTDASLASAIERLRQLDSISDLRLVSDDSNGSPTKSLSFCTSSPETANAEVLSIVLAMGLKPYSLVETIMSLERVYLDLDRQLSDENAMMENR